MDVNLLFYAAIFILSYIITQKLLHKLQNLPPTPFPTLPILGHLHLLKNPTKIHRTLAKISNQYGPVVQLWLGFRRTLLVSSASVAEDCLHHNDIIFANRPRLMGAKIIGYNYTNILWAPYGPLWRNHRRIAATEILSPHRLNLLANIRADEVRFLIKRIYDQGNRTVEIKPALIELTNNIMMRMIAGKRIYGETEESEEGKRFKLLIKELLGFGGAFSAGDLFPFFKYLGLNKGAEKRFRAMFVKIDEFFQELVDEQRRKMEEEGNKDDGSNLSGKDNKNLIQVLLALQHTDPSYFTEDIIKGLVQILLLTGTETTSSTVEWATTLLLKNPEIHNKARKEIHDKVGYNRLIEERDLQNLPYLHCIINETLRMYPVAPVLPPHESSEDCVVGGYHIPRGTMLNLNLWAIQNDPKVWDEPSKFKPERFENVEGDRVGYIFMPFGTGRRACPGENMATRVLGLTLGSLIQCFEWESAEEEIDMEEKVAVSMWKANPLQAKFKPCKEMMDIISQI